MKKLILCLVLLFLPINSYAYENLDLKKLEESFKLDCKNYGNESCTARFLAMAGCSYFMGINSGKESNSAMKVSDLLFIALMRGNQIDPEFMFDENNNFKAFGTGKNKTIYPFWLVTTALSLLIYLYLIVKNGDFV